MLGKLILLVVLTALSQVLMAESRTVFKGVPAIKVSEGGLERSPERLPRERAFNLGCVISEIDGKFYWATRENKPMVRIASGAFVTFLALDGAGYVRIIPSDWKNIAALSSPTESRFDYVEHMLIGLRSVTYYGSSE